MKKGDSSSQTEIKILTLIGLAVGLFAIPSFNSLMKFPSPQVVGGVVEESRSPASVSEPAVPLSQSFEWPCSADESKNILMDSSVDSSIKQVRLQSSICLKDLVDIRIQNQTNGFTASVFPLKTRSFTTDFMDLKPGENRLVLSAMDSKGQKVQKQFVIHRREPAQSSGESR